MVQALIEAVIDLPNWLKPIPGLVMLGISGVIFLSGYIWPLGIGAGFILLLAGFALMGKNKGGYHF